MDGDGRCCPECGARGEYQGVGMVGDNWTGTRVTAMYCDICETNWKIERRGQTPTSRRRY